MLVTVERIVEAAQLVESELRAQGMRLREVVPRDEDEAAFFQRMADEYESSADGVRKLWEHQRKRLTKLAHVAAGTGYDEQGRPAAVTAEDDKGML